MFSFHSWKKARVRLIERDSFYIRFTPNVGFGIPWFRNKANNRMRRLRWAFHHGLQIVEWRGARWVVTKQVLGTSKVNKEAFDIQRRK